MKIRYFIVVIQLISANDIIFFGVHAENCIEYGTPHGNLNHHTDNSRNETNQNWQQSQCGADFFDVDEFVIHSPGYPNGYPSSADCVYRLGGTQCERKYRFQILDFNLEQSLGCVKDRLEVQHLDAICGSLSGTKEYQTADGQLRLRFISDLDFGGRGFRILVTKLPCEHLQSNIGTTIIPLNPIYPPSPSTPTPPPIFPPQPPGPLPTPGTLPFCCGRFYNVRHFMIASPEFPRSREKNADCLYHVYRANANVCRLRMHFHFFRVGSESTPGYPGGTQIHSCSQGYFELDGKRFCGCKTGVNVISNFDSNWGNRPKVLRFKNGLFSPQMIFNSYSGFAIEIIQDECPYKYDGPSANDFAPETKNIPWKRNRRQLSPLQEITDYRTLGNDALSFPWRSSAIPFLKERTEIIDDADGTAGINSPDVIKHLYFFKAPEDYSYDGTNYNNFGNVNFNKEEATYVDTSDGRNIGGLNGPQNEYRCNTWGLIQYTLLTKHPLWQQMPRCSSNQIIPPPQPGQNRCQILNELRGTIQSPGFPLSYPSNLNICYRFAKQIGYCGFKITMTDFQLEESRNCAKDYLQFGGQYNYCGKSLAGTVSTINLAHKDHEDVHFVSDSYYSVRGFRGIYEQVACAAPPYLPPQPDMPATPSPPIVPLPVLCGGNIDADFYIVEIPPDVSHCLYTVFKSSQSVCRVQMSFLNFDIDCEKGRILINGKEYCGTLTGQKIFVDFNSFNQMNVIYNKDSSLTQPIQSRFPIRIAISQIRTGCDPYHWDIPAERRLTLCPTQEASNLTGVIIVNPRTHKDHGRNVDEKKDKCEQTLIIRGEGICVLQLNLSNIDLPDSKDCLQSFILLNNQHTCGLSNQLVDVAFVNSTLTVSFKLNSNKTEYIQYKQIPCESVNSGDSTLIA